VAVIVPCLIGCAVAFRQGYFTLEPFILVIVGLVMVESANLFMADWAAYRSSTSSKWKPPPAIEGSPMLSERVLPLRYSIHAAGFCLALAALIFAYFAIRLGFLIILLGTLALLIGAFYVLSPIKYGFFSTAFLPPIIASGSYYVLAGSIAWQPALASIPMMLTAAGVIFTYRVLYGEGGHSKFQKHNRMLLAIYSLAYVALAALVLGGLTSASLILGFVGMPILVPIAKSLNTKNHDYLPATSLGVLLHTVMGILIALSYMLLEQI
jgi:1,4-dihydroxy-2-naphthoate octaprenyltransferase